MKLRHIKKFLHDMLIGCVYTRCKRMITDPEFRKIYSEGSDAIELHKRTGVPIYNKLSGKLTLEQVMRILKKPRI